MNSALYQALSSAVGTGNVLTNSEDICKYSNDWRGRFSGEPACVVIPPDVTAVQLVVRVCAAMNVPMVPQGGNTSLCGGATPRGGEVVISLLRLDRLRWMDVQNHAFAVDAGCTLHQVKQAAEEAGKMFPLSLAAEGSATIGGNLSTNAGGVQVIRYGTVRNLVLGLEAILPDGRLWDDMKALRKDNTGYDLKDLFIGAEGTLGLITGAVLKLLPRPKHILTAWLAVSHPGSGVAVMSRLRDMLGDSLSAFELVDSHSLDLLHKHLPSKRPPLNGSFPWQVLVEAENCQEETFLGSLAGLLGMEIIDAAIARNVAESEAFWALRESIPEVQKREGHSIKHDISLPISRIPTFIDRADSLLNRLYPGVRIVCFGHLGDGNLHYNLSMPDPEENERFLEIATAVSKVVHDMVHDMGGTISAEHGIGQLKREDILRYKNDVAIDLMRRIKKSFDPGNLMNPGKVI